MNIDTLDKLIEFQQKVGWSDLKLIKILFGQIQIDQGIHDRNFREDIEAYGNDKANWGDKWSGRTFEERLEAIARDSKTWQQRKQPNDADQGEAHE